MSALSNSACASAHLALLEERVAELVVQRRIVGVEPQRRGERVGRVGPLALVLVDDAHVVIGGRIRRIDRRRRLEIADRRVEQLLPSLLDALVHDLDRLVVLLIAARRSDERSASASQSFHAGDHSTSNFDARPR